MARTTQKDHANELAFTAINYKLMLVSIGVIVLGFLLMAGGGSGDPNVFNEEEIFSPRRITVAPIVVLIGYVLLVYAIMKRPAQEEERA